MDGCLRSGHGRCQQHHRAKQVKLPGVPPGLAIGNRVAITLSLMRHDMTLVVRLSAVKFQVVALDNQQLQPNSSFNPPTPAPPNTSQAEFSL